jgi:predicted DNA-binding protein (UPF0251 family)
MNPLLQQAHLAANALAQLRTVGTGSGIVTLVKGPYLRDLEEFCVCCDEQESETIPRLRQLYGNELATWQGVQDGCMTLILRHFSVNVLRDLLAPIPALDFAELLKRIEQEFNRIGDFKLNPAVHAVRKLMKVAIQNRDAVDLAVDADRAAMRRSLIPAERPESLDPVALREIIGMRNEKELDDTDSDVSGELVPERIHSTQRECWGRYEIAEADAVANITRQGMFAEFKPMLDKLNDAHGKYVANAIDFINGDANPLFSPQQQALHGAIDELRRSLPALYAARPKATTKRKPSRNRQRRKATDRPMTAKEVEAVKTVGECNGNFAEAGRRLGKNRKTVKQLHDSGLKKAGTKNIRHKTEQIRHDKRGQANLANDSDRR